MKGRIWNEDRWRGQRRILVIYPDSHRHHSYHQQPPGDEQKREAEITQGSSTLNPLQRPANPLEIRQEAKEKSRISYLSTRSRSTCEVSAAPSSRDLDDCDSLLGMSWLAGSSMVPSTWTRSEGI